MQHLHRQCNKLNDTCTSNAMTQGHLQQPHIRPFVQTKLQKAKKGPAQFSCSLYVDQQVRGVWSHLSLRLTCCCNSRCGLLLQNQLARLKLLFLQLSGNYIQSGCSAHEVDHTRNTRSAGIEPP